MFLSFISECNQGDVAIRQFVTVITWCHL